jgi:hypothetical protein
MALQLPRYTSNYTRLIGGHPCIKLTVFVTEIVGTLSLCRWSEEANTVNVLVRKHTQHIQAGYER